MLRTKVDKEAGREEGRKSSKGKQGTVIKVQTAGQEGQGGTCSAGLGSQHAARWRLSSGALSHLRQLPPAKGGGGLRAQLIKRQCTQAAAQCALSGTPEVPARGSPLKHTLQKMMMAISRTMTRMMICVVDAGSGCWLPPLGTNRWQEPCQAAGMQSGCALVAIGTRHRHHHRHHTKSPHAPTFIFMLCHHILLRNCRPVLWNLSACTQGSGVEWGGVGGGGHAEASVCSLPGSQPRRPTGLSSHHHHQPPTHAHLEAQVVRLVHQQLDLFAALQHLPGGQGVPGITHFCTAVARGGAADPPSRSPFPGWPPLTFSILSTMMPLTSSTFVFMCV